MSPDVVCRMSTEQINTALDRLQRELNALLEDQRVLLEETGLTPADKQREMRLRMPERDERWTTTVPPEDGLRESGHKLMKV